MTELFRPGAPQVLMHEMRLDDANIERRKRIVGFEAKDFASLSAIRNLLLKNIDDFVATFFEHLAGLEEAKPLFASRTLLQRAHQLKTEHLLAMARGEYGKKYVEQRLELGLLYAQVGLNTRVFLGAYHVLLERIGTTIMKEYASAPEQGFKCFVTIQKIAIFDIGIIIDVMVPEREHIIRQQQEAIRELSTPVLTIGEHLLLLPIVGAIDSHRALLLTDSLLRSIRTNRAKVAVMDLTGVGGIDSKVANHLLQTVAAARILGAQVIVTGLGADVAQSLVMLGINLDALVIKGDLQKGLEEADRLLSCRKQQFK